MMFKAILFTVLLIVLTRADIYDELIPEIDIILKESIIPGKQVRLCTCEEQAECITEAKMHALDCADTCWDKLKGRFQKPDEVKKCLLNKDVEVAMTLDCFERNAHSCQNTRTDEQVPARDTEKTLNNIMAHLKKNANKAASSFSTPVQRLIGTTEAYGTCVKNCVVEKNKGKGFCFDQKQCQLKLSSDKIKESIKTCTEAQDWRKKAGDTCKCISDAGVTEIEQICPLVKALTEKTTKN